MYAGVPRAFPVRVSREINVFHLLGGLFELGDELLLAFDDFVPRFETVFDIDCQVLLGKVLNMSERSFDDKLLAQVFVDGLRLCRRLHDYQSLCHRILSDCGRLCRDDSDDC